MANERVVPKSNEYKEYYIPLKRAERQIHPGVFIFFYSLSLSLSLSDDHKSIVSFTGF